MGESAMKALHLITAGVLSLMLSAPVHAASYPERAVTVVVPFPPGGATDTTARVTTQEMQKSFGQPLVVENKPGPTARSAPGRSPGPSPTAIRC
jgi:tripartite-type tricarboxylate transporter receptor subunit TctC